MAFKVKTKKSKLKSITMDYGEGKKEYFYRESDRKRFYDKYFLGNDDAIELAINKQMNRDRKRREKGV